MVGRITRSSGFSSVLHILSTLLEKALLSVEGITETALRLPFSLDFVELCLKLSVHRARKNTDQFTVKLLSNQHSRMTNTNPSNSSKYVRTEFVCILSKYEVVYINI